GLSATIIYIIAGYTAIILIAYLVQEKLIFKPEKLPQNFEYKYDAPFEELFLILLPAFVSMVYIFMYLNPKV
ncbi:hypothetical protein ABTK14_21150, partial [Acinetobacter baumannii]